ncbi:MAG: tetratricopeptide repeat protein, partial [Bacteroidia bacterium]
MKKVVYLSVFFMFILGSISAQKKQNVIDKTGDIGKMVVAEQKFYAMDYKGALSIYQDVLTGKPDDANVIFHIAECYYELHQYKEATENAEKAKKTDPKANIDNSLLLGKLYQLDGRLDEALAEFTTYKAEVGSGKKATESGVDMYIG